jgi:hypothetical protein
MGAGSTPTGTAGDYRRRYLLGDHGLSRVGFLDGSADVIAGRRYGARDGVLRTVAPGYLRKPLIKRDWLANRARGHIAGPKSVPDWAPLTREIRQLIGESAELRLNRSPGVVGDQRCQRGGTKTGDEPPSIERVEAGLRQIRRVPDVMQQAAATRISPSEPYARASFAAFAPTAWTCGHRASRKRGTSR